METFGSRKECGVLKRRAVVLGRKREGATHCCYGEWEKLLDEESCRKQDGLLLDGDFLKPFFIIDREMHIY